MLSEQYGALRALNLNMVENDGVLPMIHRSQVMFKRKSTAVN